MQRRTAGYTLATLFTFGSILACNSPVRMTTAGDAQASPTSSEASATPSEPQAETPTESQVPATPTETPLPTETPTPSPTPGPNFGQASIYAVSHLGGDRLLVTIQVPGGGFATSYFGRIAASDLPCEVLGEYPDRLYCTGPEPYENYSTKAGTLQLFPSDGVEPVFETGVNIPPRPTPTPEPTVTPTPTFFINLSPFPVTLMPLPPGP